jgi:excisionase family DNA binding protein
VTRPAVSATDGTNVASVDQSGLELYTVQEVADRLGVHPETIRRLIHGGRMEAVRVGRVLRVHPDALETFLARQRVKPARPLP